VHQIEVIGLGSGTIDQLPYGIYKKMTEASETVYTRTMDHPVIKTLQEEGVKFHSFDRVYEKHDQFGEVYEEIVDELVQAAETDPIIYTVPGHPMVAEKTVELLLERLGVKVHISGGKSFLDDVFTAVHMDPIDGFQFIDATAFDPSDVTYRQHTIFCQVYDQMVASNVKLTLLEDLPPSFEVAIIDRAGTPEEVVRYLPIEELDREVWQSNLMVVYVPPVDDALLHHQWNTLRDVIAILRGPDGCPWDQKQTHESLRKYALEEVYELIEAIDAGDDDAIIAELGDVLLQVMLHSQIGEDNGYFTINDVIKSTTDKMIRRHPHVFGGAIFSSEEELKQAWEMIKQQEKGAASIEQCFFASIPKNSPALMRSEDIQRKAVAVGFDWEHVDHVWEKLTEELGEVKEAIAEGTKEEIEDEFGDVFFVLVNIARYYHVHAELALHHANEKFMTRFSYVEEQLRMQGKGVTDAGDDEVHGLWEEAKERTKKQ